MMQCWHRDDPDPQGRAVTALEPEELFIVGVLRAWVSMRRPGRDTPLSWRDVFAMAELPSDAAAAFDGLIVIVARAMRRALDVRCRHCPQVGADEEAMLRMMGAVQARDRLTGLDELSAWLVPESLMPALDAAERLAALLASLASTCHVHQWR
jgi:hypothetical protein